MRTDLQWSNTSLIKFKAGQTTLSSCETKVYCSLHAHVEKVWRDNWSSCLSIVLATLAFKGACKEHIAIQHPPKNKPTAINFWHIKEENLVFRLYMHKEQNHKFHIWSNNLTTPYYISTRTHAFIVIPLKSDNKTKKKQTKRQTRRWWHEEMTFQ